MNKINFVLVFSLSLSIYNRGGLLLLSLFFTYFIWLVLAAIWAEKVVHFIDFFLTQNSHTLRVKPCVAAIAFYVEQIRIEWFLAGAELVPGCICRFKGPSDRTVRGSREKGLALINLAKLIILLDSEDLALTNNCLYKD